MNLEAQPRKGNENKSIRLGLCCMNKTLRNSKPPIYASRTIRIKQYQERGVEELKRRALLNLEDLVKMIEWNYKNNIEVFRLSSDIFPHLSNPTVPFYGFDFARGHLKKIGLLGRIRKQRFTFHPGQFNVLGTPMKETLDKTIIELDRTSEILDIMGCDGDSVIVIHGGGVYGNKQQAIERWVENFKLLSESAQKRLVLENCEKSYNVSDCLQISEKIKERYGFALPIVLDIHHYHCFSLIHKDVQQDPLDTLIPKVLDTWKSRNIRPKFHISEQGLGKVGHHSDMIDSLPKEFLNIPSLYNIGLDIMIEAKFKELAILKLYDDYPLLFKKNMDNMQNESIIKVN